MKAETFDKIHWNSNAIDGTRCDFRYVVSLRGGGKSTYFHVKKAYPKFINEGKSTILVRRHAIDITDGYIDSLFGTLSKFGIDVEYTYKMGDKKEGICDIKEKTTKKVIYRIIALNSPPSRHKSLMLRDVAYMTFDEFICNPEFDEKYLKKETIRYKEIYNTYWRENNDMVAYFFGNLYSWYNPYFTELGITPKDFTEKSIAVRGKSAVEFFEPSPELKELLAKNPLYAVNSKYTDYALNGIAYNDQNARIIDRCPQGFSLKYQFKIEDDYYQIWKSNEYSDDIRYWVGKSSTPVSRKTFAFDFKDLVSGAILWTSSDRLALRQFSHAVYGNAVGYDSLDSYYMMMEVHKRL